MSALRFPRRDAPLPRFWDIPVLESKRVIIRPTRPRAKLKGERHNNEEEHNEQQHQQQDL